MYHPSLDGRSPDCWYRALTVYLTSKTTYVGARDATVRAAADLGYGTAEVRAAWNAVAVPVSSAG